ncbi:STAS/SEC14 domain-containing protein [Mesorhizobium sp.]|uniref:STAS/SEC14 domain-containing protein n=1 Tax=Mesorhizobium sp. TaxID=1871066 RepID=UPI000FE4D82B|nr:STAS/SEC14 domain-containing protein [Mesorhizobium sp.]RWK42563.1 MAG: STAS/SEC14 domain-containing protein [Mesorhizobium sp.]RWK68849.1 MAG: STAS/SEC14 domain-containing protein [Mesorhizobium sp.]RWK76493.1 MAG: STAS/SEC14 domain-containing protein [Mesorhizobium sp.]RWK82242.1 MAG: STAS/SEC14 domain-containing protein [Mesorhizobium sp.]RWL02933.1 MAG: STAS/SEC14 domain-containing protein [Mesorhizobium sp.]
MNYLEAVPAVRRIDTDRDDLFAIDVVGHVTAADAENLFGLLEAAYALHPKIDVLMRLIDHEGVDWADVSDETLEQGTAHAVEHVGRCAAVGEPNWVPSAQSLLPASSSVELRHFEAKDEASAWAWLDARPLAPR